MDDTLQSNDMPSAPTTSVDPWLEFPLTYRVEQVATLAHWAGLGESVMLLGGSGSGKSNLLRFLSRRPEAIAPHVPAPVEQYCLLYFDMNSLPRITDIYFYRGLIQTIYDNVEFCAPALGEAIHQAVRSVTNWSDIFEVSQMLRHLHRLLIGQHSKRVIWLIDRFGETFQYLDAQTLNNLRGLRDQFKGRLSFVTASRHPLPKLRNPHEIDELLELMAAHTCRLGPMTRADTMWNIQRMGRRLQCNFHPALARRIAVVSGGLPAFVKQMCVALAEGSISAGQTNGHWAHQLLARNDFQRSCREIWEDLDATRQEILKAVSAEIPAGHLLHSEAVADLLQSGWIVRVEGADRFEVFSLIFDAFVVNKRGGLTAGTLSFDPATHKLRRDGIMLNIDLTDQEERLFVYMLEHPSRLCEKDELIQVVWPHENQNGDSVRDDRLTQLMRRLRRKIEPDIAKPRYIITVRGKGYRFMPSGDMPAQSL